MRVSLGAFEWTSENSEVGDAGIYHGLFRKHGVIKIQTCLQKAMIG